jgi:hypothetical protein
MKKYSFILIACLAGLLLSSSTSRFTAPVFSGTYLGFNLMPGPNNGMINFALITPLPNGRQDIKYITRNEFVRRACSTISCDGNIAGENLFVKYEVEDCGAYRDSIFKKTSFACSAIDQLWKLRYKMSPYGAGTDSLGWTGATIPSMGQMNILKQYGSNNLDDYIYGENAFKLLHDMQSYAWQSRYKGS